MSDLIRPTYLQFTEAGATDHNKFYNMFPEANGNTFRVEYGRVGAKASIRTYPIGEWETKYWEKIKKGYKDYTELKQDLVESVTVAGDTTYTPIAVTSIRDIVEKLQSLARDAVQKNYTVKASAVTQAMVDKAQEYINDLVECANKKESVTQFNLLLTELFNIIPRKMDRVANYLANNYLDYNKILDREQNTLDVMRGQVYVPSATPSTTPTTSTGRTVLEANGLIMEECGADEVALIKSLMDAHGSNSSYHFRRAWKVTNIATQQRYDSFVKVNNIQTTKLLWHGSRTENFWSIMKTGLMLRPNAQVSGKMFGQALYSALKCQKSIGYTSLGGSYWANGNDRIAYMALFDTAYGVPYHTYDNYEFSVAYDEATFKRLHPGCNCVHAHAGSQLRNDEIMVYNEAQMTIKYLVEIE